MNFFTPEYFRSNAATTSGAVHAWQDGATGLGIKIAVLDTGINPALVEFAGRIDPASQDVAGNRGLGDVDGHGTAVSAVIAAARNDIDIMGVAFESTIIALRTDDPGSCGTPDDCAFFDSDLAAAIDIARQAGATVINMSLGGGTPSNAVLNAMQRAVNDGIIFVIAAGNEGDEPDGGNPNPFAGIPAQLFPNHVIIAGSINGNDVISPFSNKAGTGANNYLTALGDGVRTFDQTGTAFLYSGTSFSTPIISAALALLADAFPNLTGPQLIEILFTSAQDLGAVGTDNIYGHGKLNLERAFQPIGTTSLAGTEILVGGTGTTGDLPGAAGDAADDCNGDCTVGKLGVVILDGYDRAFTTNLANGLRRAQQETPLRRALQGNVSSAGFSAGSVNVAMTIAQRELKPGVFETAHLGIGPDDVAKARVVAAAAVARLDDKTAVALGFSKGAKEMERRLAGVQGGNFLIARDVAAEPGFQATRDNSMAIRRDLGPVNVTFSGETGEIWQEVQTSATGSPYRMASVSFDKRLGRTWLSASFSRLEEKRTVLGGRMGAAFGGDSGSTTDFIDLEARHEFGSGITAGVTARRGWTSFGGGAFQTGAYAVEVNKEGVFNYTDVLGFRVSQPLRIEQGGFALLLPTSYDYATETATTSLERFSLSPSGREINAEFSYSTVLGKGWLSGNVFMRRQPGHIASADNDYGAAVRYRVKF